MPMEFKDKKIASDDEEDLELLRIAALSTLKRPSNPPQNQFLHGNKHLMNHKRRGFPNRNRNGQFNNRIKNTNLIAIPTVDVMQPVREQIEDTPKLILPQDRYHNIKPDEGKQTEATSKFDRYDNSDKSDSESEYESQTDSESDSPAKLERANSLEALMQELENEITGDAKSKDETMKSETKKVKKRRKKRIVKEEIPVEVLPEKVDPADKVEPKVTEVPIERKRSTVIPPRRRNFRYQDRNRGPPCGAPYHYAPPPLYQPPMIFEHVIPQFPPMYTMPPVRPFYERPLSPLRMNTEDVLTITRAPLSPRSAAFVLQNRDAIERRKKSPRRSYSRSPSPRYRKSCSPRPKSRSRTPLKDEKRVSPVRRENIVRYPERREKTPEKSKNNLKLTVRDRLGNKGKPGVKRSRSPSPIIEKKVAKIEKTEPLDLDPVLEARKKKFESNEIKAKEGIIRLKPKTEEPEDKPAETIEKPDEEKPPTIPIPTIPKPTPPKIEPEEDLLLYEDPFDEILNTKVDDLFSDEETDDENEGRFKTTINEKRNIHVLPKPKNTEDHRRRVRSRSPLRSRNVRGRTQRERRRGEGKRVTAPIENKKIEIKIRNPTKYETTSKYDVANEHEIEREKAPRKVEVSKSEIEELDEIDLPDIELDSKGEEAGDLRAQLRRKRAERQNRLPVAEDVQSRLLQNALQGAVFKKQKKVKAEKETSTKDGKRPIHMRLGFSNGDVFQETPGKKSRKSGGNKNKARPEQV